MKEKVESTYTRRVKVRSNEKLERAFSESIVTATKLYNFTLKYLEATYGYKHIRRWIPTGQSKNYLTNLIKTKFLLKYYNQDKWSQKLTNLNSQSHY